MCETVHHLPLYVFVACKGKGLLFFVFSCSAVTALDGVVLLLV
jgi:hypothetical protein